MQTSFPARRRTSGTLLGLVLLAVTGCTTTHTRIETEIQPDGTVRRALVQHRSRLPDKSLPAADWQGTTWLKSSQAEKFSGRIDALPVRGPDESREYVAAWGNFDSVAEIPEHYEHFGPDQDFRSRVNSNLKSTDYVLVTDYQWSETVTETVTLSDFRAARSELFRFLTQFYEHLLSEGLGSEYDVAKLVRWIRTGGRGWFFDMTDTLYELGIPATSADEDAFERRFLEISQRRGLIPEGQDISRFESESGEPDIDQMMSILVRHYVKRRDGQPLSDDEVNAVNAIFTLDFDSSSPLMKRLDLAYEQALHRYPGGKQAVEDLQANLSTRMLGVHGSSVLSPEEFHFSVTLPGVIVETSGQLQSDVSASWNFDATRAWPRGFKMTCRSLLDQSAVIPELQTRKEPLSRRALLAIVELVGEDEELLAVLIACRTQKSLQPLRESAEQNGGDSNAARVLHLLLPKETSAASASSIRSDQAD